MNLRIRLVLTALAAVAPLAPACVAGRSPGRTPAAPTALEVGAPSSRTPQLETVVESPPTADEWLIGHGEPFRPSDLERWVAEVEAMTDRTPIDAERPDSFGHTLLHKAAIAARTDLARRLVALGANPNALSIFAYTPLDLIQQGAGPRDRRGIGEVAAYLISVGGGYCYYGVGGERYIPNPQKTH